MDKKIPISKILKSTGLALVSLFVLTMAYFLLNFPFWVVIIITILFFIYSLFNDINLTMSKSTFLIFTTILIIGGGIINQILKAKCNNCAGYSLGLLPLNFFIFLIWLYFGVTLKKKEVDLNILHINKKREPHILFKLFIFLLFIIPLLLLFLMIF